MCNHLAQLNHEIVLVTDQAHLKDAEAASSGSEDQRDDPAAEGMSPGMPCCDRS
jgi:hypothetical protein